MRAGRGSFPRFFDVHDAEWCCLLNEKQQSTEQLSGRQAAYLSKIRRASLLSDPPECLSLYGVAFDPGFYIPTHYHDVDQFLLVVDGEFRMGRRRLRAGQGMFTPAGNPYNVKVGRAGGRFLEFREIPAYRTAFAAKDAHHAGPGAPLEIPGWSKPAERLRTEFFDAETCTALECRAFGPGDLGSRVPSALSGAVRYQALHLPSNHGYSMISVMTDRAVDFPAHRQDADKIVYVLSGELKIGTEALPLRAGAGFFVPAMARSQFSAGPAGVKYAEFRKQATWRTQWLSEAN